MRNNERNDYLFKASDEISWKPMQPINIMAMKMRNVIMIK